MKTNVKKTIVSLLIITGFVFYSVYQRFGDGLQKYFFNSLSEQYLSGNFSGRSNESPSSKSGSNLPASQDNNTDAAITVKGIYKDGEYIGNDVDAYYGKIKVKAIISSGKLSDIVFLSYPNDRSYSVEINTLTMPKLIAEAIQAQSAQVDIISGATNTSKAFIKSLEFALNLASGKDTKSSLGSEVKSVDIASGATNSVSSAASFIGITQTTVDIVSGATLKTETASKPTASVSTSTTVDILSGATSTPTTSASGTATETTQAAVDALSGATNTTTTTQAPADVLQVEQNVPVDIVSGATNVTSTTSASVAADGTQTSQTTIQSEYKDDDNEGEELESHEDKNEDD